MRKLCAVLLTCLLAGQGAFAAAHHHEMPKDKTAPRIIYSTNDGDVMIGNPDPTTHSDLLPLEVRGIATDSGSGVRSVTAAWVRCLESSSTSCTGTGVSEPLPPPSTFICSGGSRCDWHLPTPAAPGNYWVAARATDRAGNRSHHEGILHVVVV